MSTLVVNFLSPTKLVLSSGVATILFFIIVLVIGVVVLFSILSNNVKRVGKYSGCPVGLFIPVKVSVQITFFQS